MNIIDVGLQFNSNMSRMGNINGIVLHHTAVSTPQSIEVIHNYHKSLGWAGIGYHYYVRKDGSVYKGRPEEYAGAHCPGVNSTSIGICAEGNFNEESMSDAQKNAIIELVAYVKSEHNITYIKGHREIIATSCPGSNYPLDEIRNAQPQPTPPEPQPTGDKQIREIQEWCNSYGTGIAVDGYYGNETKKAIIKVYQTELNRQFGRGLDVDGIFGQATKRATPIVRPGSRGNITKNIQAMLYCRDYNTNGVDGIYGSGTEKAVRNFQANHVLSADGIFGENTGYKLYN